MAILRFKYLERPLRWEEVEVPLNYNNRISPNNDTVIVEFHKEDLTENEITEASKRYTDFFNKNNFKQWLHIIK